MIQKKVKVPVTHEVTLSITRDGKLKCQPARVEVRPRDLIVWKWRARQDFPFGLVIKSPITPLLQNYYVTSLKRGVLKVIQTRVLDCAPPGTYPYLAATFADGKLLVEDPELIVRPPAGGGK
ncbi:MAG: hypothetical protein OP8BY_1438 [Candidatus Saccharicenans subterraneus]|uniref:Uncharacterized protein n=1 Tax=Candidatus Saccharicenans subterraneus TaxID=2508984 RepID=A0A3E2BJK7_9BACT|nr:MAG: hypothetical protein OP8BY_1438 [Candidatus Saccharicenans subterraneum]